MSCHTHTHRQREESKKMSRSELRALGVSPPGPVSRTRLGGGEAAATNFDSALVLTSAKVLIMPSEISLVRLVTRRGGEHLLALDMRMSNTSSAEGCGYALHLDVARGRLSDDNILEEFAIIPREYVKLLRMLLEPSIAKSDAAVVNAILNAQLQYLITDPAVGELLRGGRGGRVDTSRRGRSRSRPSRPRM